MRVARAAYGQALTGAGQTGAAIAELSASLADRRDWLADKPDMPSASGPLIIGLQALADALAAAGRRAEACAMLGEAGGMVQRMTKAGSFTQQDRDSIMPLRAAAVARSCPAVPAA